MFNDASTFNSLHLNLIGYFQLQSYSLEFIFLLLLQYICLHFHCTLGPCPIHPRFPPSKLPPLALSMCPLYMFLDGPSPIFPHYPSPSSSLVTVTLFFNSTFLVIFCLLICFFVCLLFIDIQIQLSPFAPHHAPLPHPSPLSTRRPTLFGFVHVSFIHVP